MSTTLVGVLIMQKMTLNRHPNSLLFEFVDSREVWSTILGKPKVRRNETLFDDGYDCADITRVHDHFNYVLHFFHLEYLPTIIVNVHL